MSEARAPAAHSRRYAFALVELDGFTLWLEGPLPPEHMQRVRAAWLRVEHLLSPSLREVIREGAEAVGERADPYG